MGALDENGNFQTIAQKGREAAQKKKEKENDRAPAPQSEPTPPGKTDSGPDPGPTVVDEFYVEMLGHATLPTEEDSADYRSKAREGTFSDLATQVLDGSGVDLKDFNKTLKTLTEKVARAREDLNKKDEPGTAATKTVEFEPLPGVVQDAVCKSTFDASDLALTGKKAVTTRQFNQPLVLVDAPLIPDSAAQPWLLGQKMEWAQEWRHEGFTLGELVSSLSLLPAEELTIEVSSYQRTRQEIQDESDESKRMELMNELRSTDERSTTNQTAASNGWSVSATASVNYPVASASLSAGANGNSSEQAEQTRRQLNESTARSASEVSSRRAVKITQTKEAGSESTTTRRLRNPNTCQTVTYNFFQVIKLYDLQIRLADDRPLLLLPGIFPRFYGPQDLRKGEVANVLPTEVDIPTHLVEGWRAPSVFLTRYFSVDRELSTQISGWALRLRISFDDNPEAACRLFAEGLVVAARYLYGLDPSTVVKQLAQILRQLCQSILEGRSRAANNYGVGKGDTVQVNTPGVYVDALRGRCTACPDHEEADHYVDVMTKLEELRRLQRASLLDDKEIARRTKRLDAGDLEPFEPVPATS